ncbi:MAG: hypothetical protein HYZ13_01620 [Acidobacteria bacterium]|nr:hypothetical protein [Acidobacteriota bacterium]
MSGLVASHIFLLAVLILVRNLKNFQLFGVTTKLTSSVVQAGLMSQFNSFCVQIVPFLTIYALTVFVVFYRCVSTSAINKKGSFALGVSAYLALSLTLIFSRPGSLAFIPILNRLPFWVGYLLLAILFGTMILFLPAKLKQKGGLIALTVLWVNLPHHVLRSLWNSAKPVINQQIPRRIVLSLDSARFDDVTMSYSNRKPSIGISQFQSTRKQWQVMMGRAPESMGSMLFLPNAGEVHEQKFESPFEQEAALGSTRIAFILDDGGTANRKTLPLRLSEVSINGEGIDSAGSSEKIPISAWLQNIVSSTESANIYSDIDSFFCDMSGLLARNDMVFAHSCYLEHPMATWQEFFQFDSYKWFLKKPLDYTSYNNKSVSMGGISTQKISSFRTNKFIQKVNVFFEKSDDQYEELYGVFTSDHGQDYEAVSKEVGVSTHGFLASSGCAWIPIVPYGRTRIAPESGGRPITWQDISNGLLASLKHHTPLVLSAGAPSIACSFPFIAPPLVTWGGNASRTLNMSEISENTFYSDQIGLYFLPTMDISGYKKSYVYYSPEDVLHTINPISGKAYRVQEWRGYSLLKDSIVDEADLPAILASIGFRPI